MKCVILVLVFSTLTACQFRMKRSIGHYPVNTGYHYPAPSGYHYPTPSGYHYPAAGIGSYYPAPATFHYPGNLKEYPISVHTVVKPSSTLPVYEYPESTQIDTHSRTLYTVSVPVRHTVTLEQPGHSRQTIYHAPPAVPWTYARKYNNWC